MGSIDVLGWLGWLGVASAVALAVAVIRFPRFWPYVLAPAAVGLALASRGAFVGWSLDSVLSLFATGSVLSAPLAVLAWWWLHRPGARLGTLE